MEKKVEAQIIRSRIAGGVYQSYEEWISKFGEPKTTDDCYTPPEVYDVVVSYVFEKCPQISNLEVIRPFYPGGDYTQEDYNGKVVIDNPPFSKLAEIVRYYMAHEIPYFIFAPQQTLFTSAPHGATCICVSAQVVYDNGAKVSTGFLSNLFNDKAVILDGSLKEAITQAQKQKENSQVENRNNNKNAYPFSVITGALLTKYSYPGVYWECGRHEVHYVRALDAQREESKKEGKKYALFGSGFIIGKEAEARLRAAARKAEESRKEAEESRKEAEESRKKVWQLSDREDIIRMTLSAETPPTDPQGGVKK